jgi:hypothetical protein
MDDIERTWHENAHGQGLYVLSFFESAGKVSKVFERKARQLFEEHGIADVEPETYYHYDELAPAFYGVVDEIGPKSMMEGGRQMGRDIPWPDGIETIHEGLATLDDIHQEASPAIVDGEVVDVDHPAGGYTYERLDDRSARVGIRERYPSPPVMAEGVFLGIADDLQPSEATGDIEATDAARTERKAWTLTW